MIDLHIARLSLNQQLRFSSSYRLGRVAPYRAILRYQRCDAPYRVMLFLVSIAIPELGAIPPWYFWYFDLQAYLCNTQGLQHIT